MANGQKKFEEAAARIQAKLSGGDPGAPQSLDIGGMVEIGVMLLELVTKCMGSTGSADQVMSNMKNPGLVQRFQLRRAVREHLGRDYHRRGRKVEQAILDVAAEATNEELVALVNETNDPSYY